ncbi:decarboxylating 6-phosphogluconate dehydrogenase [soil metagenome]
MKLAMIGLGKMGGRMAERLRRHGHEVVGFDSHSDSSDVRSLEELRDALGDAGERVAWSMVPAGEPTESTVDALGELLGEGDIVIDGGNSIWTDSVRRGEMLAGKGIAFIDAGTSGGVWGLDNGYCLMVGGTAEAVARVQPVFDDLAPEGGFAHVGEVGTGSFTKMVHNGIEYGLMQAYAEGYAILDKSGLGIDAPAALSAWRQGSVVRSWLLDLLVAALEENPGLKGIKAVAADSGEGRWTVNEAVRLGVAAPVISAALFARFTSQVDDDVSMKVIAALRKQFGGHAVEIEE